jgi:transcription antitermination factor NusG
MKYLLVKMVFTKEIANVVANLPQLERELL